MVIYLKKMRQSEKEMANHTARAMKVVLAACHSNRIIRRPLMQAYTKKANAAASIERASMAAYVGPSEQVVSMSVVKATDGAAPKSPAKLFGFRTSPKAAKQETMSSLISFSPVNATRHLS
jgi:hypothetical protein